MKTFNNPFPLILVCIIALLPLSCNDDEAALNITSITLSSEKTAFLLSETIVLQATNQADIDITENVTFFADEIAIEGNTYTAEELGFIKFTAEYNGITSRVLAVTIIENITELNFVSDKSTIKAIGTDTCFFKVTNQSGVDVTSTVDLFKGDRQIYNDYYFSENTETLQFRAEYYDVKSNSVEVVVELNPSEITLSASKSTFDANGYVSPEFYVIDNDQDTLTKYAEIYTGGVLCNNQKFTTTQLGEYEFVAIINGVESNSLNLTAVPRKDRKVLIEEFTGEWCGWCPMAAYNIEKLIEERDGMVLTAAIHQGDGLEYENENLLRAAFGIGYFPSGVVGRVYLGDQVGLNGPTLDQKVIDEVDYQINIEEVLLGLDISSTLSNDEVVVDVNVHFYQDISEEVRLTIYLIENNVISGTQQNYFSGYSGYEGAYYFDQPSYINKFNHQNVLRKVATDVYGDLIPESETKQNNSYSFSQKTISMSGYDPENTYVIAFAHYPLNGENENKKIINAQQVLAGQSISNQ